MAPQERQPRPQEPREHPGVDDRRAHVEEPFRVDVRTHICLRVFENIDVVVVVPLVRTSAEFVLPGSAPIQYRYADRFELTTPSKMWFAHVRPSPAAPLLYQLFGLSAPLRSAYSVSHTGRVVAIAAPTGEEYACEVTMPSRSSAPAALICAVMVI